ncbi:MAG: MBL fold metallo-hydrolase [Thaumarchaeota archaeon]|nr:MBL fold metallo-hydrolase [Nitrososphaerota archaeon]
MLLFQLLVGNLKNFTYVIGDENEKVGVIIDPSWDLDKVMSTVRRNNLEIRYIFNTHSHWDHTIGNKEIANRTGAKIIAHECAPTHKDISAKDDDVIEVGNLKLRIFHTPGHCPDSICLMVDENLFTGDTLFVGACGRTDLPGGNPAQLYDSFFEKILKLDDHTKIYAGHDYGPRIKSTLGYEKKHNNSLQPRSKEEFIAVMGR